MFFIVVEAKEIKCVTTGTWAPFNVLIDGKLEGISVDYWHIIKNKLHLKSIYVVEPLWSRVIEDIKTKKADIALSTTITPERLKFAIFTKPYAVFPISIATRNNVGYIESIDFLKNKTIVVGKDYTVESILKEFYPKLKIVEAKNILEALKMVSNGKAFAVIDVLPVLVYNINKYTFANLKIAGQIPHKFEMRFMLSKNNTVLRDKINSVIDTISPYQREKIYRKWISVIVEKKLTLKDLLPFIITGVIIILILIFIILFLLRHNLKMKKENKVLEKLSTIDDLTGIFNKREIDFLLAKEIEIAKTRKMPFSIIFTDLDNFKRINDTYGHLEGDKVLKEMGNILKENTREYDVVGRWGGEEFLIILPFTSLEDAKKVAEKLRKKIENHHFSEKYKVTSSFGVTSFKKGDDLYSILNRADELLYKAKKEGKNRVVVG